MTRKEKDLKVLEAFGLNIGDRVKINSDTRTDVFRGNVFVITERTDGAIVLYQKIGDRVYNNITLKLGFLLDESWTRLETPLKDKKCEDFYFNHCKDCPFRKRKTLYCTYIDNYKQMTLEEIYNAIKQDFDKAKQEIYREENDVSKQTVEEQLGCPLEVREKAFDKGFYDESGNHYTCEHYVPYLKEMHTRGIMSYTEKHFKLRDYKKTWWLKADMSE